jgi:hypothetical protein
MPDVALLKYPHPFKAALAVSNDAVHLTWDAFEDWHAFVNSTGETPYGKGLGLEVGDSFRVWSKTGEFALFHGAMSEGSGAKSPEHERIRELAMAGWLDTLNGFGSREGKVDRAAVEDALGGLAAAGIGPTVFVGGAESRASNPGGVWGATDCGDDPRSAGYCLDLLRKAGFDYFWSEPFVEIQKFGDDITYSARDLKVLKLDYDASRFIPMVNNKTVLDALGVAKPDAAIDLFLSSILIPHRMRDGRKALSFKRYRGDFRPDSSIFAHQVNAARLNDLVARGASVIVQQCFGHWHAMGRAETDTRSDRYSAVPLLDDHSVWAWRFLAERQEKDEIFITTTRRLLDFVRTRRGLVYSASMTDKGMRIVLDKVVCQAYGDQPVTAATAQGLSFSAPGDVNLEVALASGQRLPVTRNFVEAENKTVVTVPWVRLEWIPKGA